MRAVMMACLLGGMLLLSGRGWAETGGAGIWAYWPLSGDYNDYSPNHRDGRAHGAVSDVLMQGPFTGATSFSGGRIEVPAASEAGADSFTVSAWVYYDKGAKGFTPLVGRVGVSGARMQLSYQPNERPDAPALLSDISLQWRRWAHITVAWDAASRTLTFWQRAIPVTRLTVPDGTPMPPPVSGPFGLGGSTGGGAAFTGRLAEVVVYTRALDSAEVQFLADGVGRQTPLQFAISSGCGGAEQGPCWVCRRYQAWPPAQWSDCAGGTQPWCAAIPLASQHATCP